MRLGLTLTLALLLTACGPTVLLDDDGGIESLPPDDAGTLISDAGELIIDAGSVTMDAGQPTDAGTPMDAGMPVTGRLLYPFGTKHSPLTADVAQHLRAITARSTTTQSNVFSKIGDSNTVNTNYLSCFGGANVDLAGRTALNPVITHFKTGQVNNLTPFARTSLSATVGWSAQAAITGTPTPLQQELDVAHPRYATVMFGTNDVGLTNPDLFGRSLTTIVDTLTAQGVVPTLSTVPPRDDDATADTWVHRYNLVTRAVAQLRQVPFIDLHPELLPLPSHGLGPDGVHLNVYTPSAGARGCVLNATGLGYGHNTRNLAVIESLSRMWNAVENGATPDASGPRRVGTGLRGDEVVIPSLPFVDSGDTRVDGAANLGTYPGCGSTANESGREVLYKLTVTAPTALRAFVISLGNADLDLHLLSSPTSGSACLLRNDKLITTTLQPGTYWLSVDTYQSSAGMLAGEYLLMVMAD